MVEINQIPNICIFPADGSPSNISRLNGVRLELVSIVHGGELGLGVRAQPPHRTLPALILTEKSPRQCA